MFLLFDNLLAFLKNRQINNYIAWLQLNGTLQYKCIRVYRMNAQKYTLSFYIDNNETITCIRKSHRRNFHIKIDVLFKNTHLTHRLFSL